MAKWVYLFEEGSADMRNLLGGKGANLAEMTRLGLPIPQGFTVTTEACTDYYNQGRKISEEIEEITFSPYRQIIFHAAALKKLEYYDGIVFIEKKEESYERLIRQEKELALDRNVSVLGVIVC